MRISVEWVGPYSGELFISHYRPPDAKHVIIGKGKSKQLAAANALSETRHLNVPSLSNEVASVVQNQLPPHSDLIEGNEFCDVYCIIGVE